jgi:hypothetical protein
MTTNPLYSFLSSSLVKEVATYGGDVSGWSRSWSPVACSSGWPAHEHEHPVRRLPPSVDDVTALPGKLLDELTELVETARAMPMSASCVVNRSEVLGLLDELRDKMPAALAAGRRGAPDRDAVVDDGRREAEQVVADAKKERLRLLSQHDIVVQAQAEAARITEEARYQADAMRMEVEDYVDAKLANFEIVLNKTLSAVARGREKLSGRHELDALGDGDDDRPSRAEPPAAAGRRPRPRRPLALSTVSTSPAGHRAREQEAAAPPRSPGSPSSSTRASWGADRDRCARCGSPLPRPRDLGDRPHRRPPVPTRAGPRLESVMEGVLVSGDGRRPARGECGRCLEPSATR